MTCLGAEGGGVLECTVPLPDATGGSCVSKMGGVTWGGGVECTVPLPDATGGSCVSKLVYYNVQ